MDFIFAEMSWSGSFCWSTCPCACFSLCLFLTSLPLPPLLCVCVCSTMPVCGRHQARGVSRAEASHTCRPSTSPAAADHLCQWPLLNWVDEFQSTLDCWVIELVKPGVWPEILLSCISWIGHWPSRLVLAGFGEECVTGAERGAFLAYLHNTFRHPTSVQHPPDPTHHWVVINW